MQSVLVWNFSHGLTTSLGLKHTSNVLICNLRTRKKTEQCKGGAISPSTEHDNGLQHFYEIWYGCGTQSVLVKSPRHDLTSSHRLNHTHPSFIMHPQLHMCNSVRIDPYAHPHHGKVLKHFVCLHMIWMLWETVSVCLEPQERTLQYHFDQIHPKFPKIQLHLPTCTKA